MFNAKVYSATSATAPLAPDTIKRRTTTEQDVQIEILFCGVCHSDLHTVRDEWNSIMPTTYPCVPGHEIVGRVTEVGSAVTNFKNGDMVGVGCLVDSDQICPSCQANVEQFCPDAVFTYNGPDKHLGGLSSGGLGFTDWKTGAQKPSQITLDHGYESGFYSLALRDGAFSVGRVLDSDHLDDEARWNHMPPAPALSGLWRSGRAWRHWKRIWRRRI